MMLSARLFSCLGKRYSSWKYLPSNRPDQIRGFSVTSWRFVTRLNTTAPSAAGFNDYEDEKKKFRLHIPDSFNFAVDAIDNWAALEQAGQFKKTNPAFWWVGVKGNEVQWSFSQLSENSKRVSSLLSGPCCLLPGDRVFVVLPKVPQWWLIAIGAWRAGIVLMPATTQLTSRDILHRIQKSNAKCVIVDEDGADQVDSIISECPSVKTKVVVKDSAERRLGWLNFKELYNQSSMYDKTRPTHSSDPMTIFFTSGSTGAPKMTLHSHATYGAAHYITGRFWMDQTPDDIYWVLADTGWAKASWFTAPWMLGSCVFVHEAPTFSPKHTLEVLNNYPITTFCAPPTAYRMMAQEDLTKYPWATLRHCIGGGEPLNPEVMDVWKNGTTHWILEGFGQTETVLTCGMFRCLPIKPGSMGKSTPGMDVRIIDENGEEVKPGQEGDIAMKTTPVKPPGLFLGYVDEPEKTAKTYRKDYYVTGDRGSQDEDGYLWFLGRADDVIITSGYRIGPFEVESALIEHPAVAESAAVSSPDLVRGEVVKAFVILTEEAANFEDKAKLTKELQGHVQETTAPYKYPRKIEFVTELPKTVSGKIRRVELRKQEWAKYKN